MGFLVLGAREVVTVWPREEDSTWAAFIINRPLRGEPLNSANGVSAWRGRYESASDNGPVARWGCRWLGAVAERRSLGSDSAAAADAGDSPRGEAATEGNVVPISTRAHFWKPIIRGAETWLVCLLRSNRITPGLQDNISTSVCHDIIIVGLDTGD